MTITCHQSPRGIRIEGNSFAFPYRWFTALIPKSLSLFGASKLSTATTAAGDAVSMNVLPAQLVLPHGLLPCIVDPSTSFAECCSCCSFAQQMLLHINGHTATLPDLVNHSSDDSLSRHTRRNPRPNYSSIAHSSSTFQI